LRGGLGLAPGMMKKTSSELTFSEAASREVYIEDGLSWAAAAM